MSGCALIVDMSETTMVPSSGQLAGSLMPCLGSNLWRCKGSAALIIEVLTGKTQAPQHLAVNSGRHELCIVWVGEMEEKYCAHLHSTTCLLLLELLYLRKNDRREGHSLAGG